MFTCPKCRSYDIAGPRYIKDNRLGCLRFQCKTCGYHEDRPTADAVDERDALKETFIRSAKS